MLVKKSRLPVKKLIFPGILPSWLKIIIYRLKGYKIGKNVKLGFASILLGDNVIIGDNVQIGHATMIRARKIIIGSYVNIGMMTMIDTGELNIEEDTKIREQVYVGGLTLPESALNIGKRCLIMQMTFINPTKPIVIGDDSAIGGNCSIFTHSSWLSKLEGYPVKYEPINIGKKVWIPWNTFITAGVNIGDHVIIGPGNIISRNIPSNSMANGNPLKIFPNIYKREMSSDAKMAIINDIVNKFCKYLEYYGYSIYKEEVPDKQLIITNKTNKKYKFIFYDRMNDSSMFDYSSDLIILLSGSIVLRKNINMVISIEDGERIGTTPAGEEFVRYLSRYGIRFKRI